MSDHLTQTIAYLDAKIAEMTVARSALAVLLPGGAPALPPPITVEPAKAAPSPQRGEGKGKPRPKGESTRPKAKRAERSPTDGPGPTQRILQFLADHGPTSSGRIQLPCRVGGTQVQKALKEFGELGETGWTLSPAGRAKLKELALPS